MSALALVVHSIATDVRFADWVQRQSEATLTEAGLQLDAGQATALLNLLRSLHGPRELCTPDSTLLKYMGEPWGPTGGGGDPI